MGNSRFPQKFNQFQPAVKQHIANIGRIVVFGQEIAKSKALDPGHLDHWEFIAFDYQGLFVPSAANHSRHRVFMLPFSQKTITPTSS